MVEVVESQEDLVQDIFDMNFLEAAFVNEMVEV